MDRFPRESVFRYAGDFDPEGLLIAQRLKIRYGERLQLWNYRVSWYEAHLSEVKLDIRRLRKLEKVCVEELQEIKAAICREGRSAYQEAMIGEICALLKNM